MKYNYRCRIFAAFIIIWVVIIIPPAYSETFQITIIPGAGSSDYCSGTSTCFTPSILNISVGDTVTWTNNDNVGHSITSGLPYGPQTGVFDSGMIAPAKTYSFTFQDNGTFKYFDKASKWMIGEVIVGPSQPTPTVPEFGISAGLVVLVSIIGVFVITSSVNKKRL
jgi:hypothetical protein